MEVLKFLDRYKKRRRSFKHSEDYKFFMANKSLLNKMPKFLHLNKKENSEFDIFRMNIVLHGFLNKNIIENETLNFEKYLSENNSKESIDFVQILKEKMVDEPYFKDGNNRIYIPFFSKAINLIYTTQPLKISKFPYSSLRDDFDDSIIDPFDTYGYELYNSYFTRLVKVYECDGQAAFFHYDTYTLYIINSQGRLDAKIVLFDRFIHHPNYNHMLERIKPILEAYFSNNLEEFLKALKSQGFMSTHLFYLIKLFDWRRKKWNTKSSLWVAK